MDASRVAFFRFRAGRLVELRAVSQRPGAPVYGPFRSDSDPRTIALAENASIGFLGTDIACAAVHDGAVPALGCFAHGRSVFQAPAAGPTSRSS